MAKATAKKATATATATARTAKTPRTPAPRRRLAVDARRAELLDLGLEAFGEAAYDEVSIDDLARRAGISKGLVYHYFGSKRGFYVAALAAAAAALLAATDVDTGGTVGERLTAALTAYLDFIDARGPAFVALMRGGIGSDAEVQAIVEGSREAIAGRILDELPSAPDRALARAAVRGWVGFVETVAIDWLSTRGPDRDELVRLCATVLFTALAAAGVVA